ncbi:hypothetical protein SAMN04488003_11319 [Loktanella fryxellensis]|uniref:Uncharacterized protein n=1 Tax=Loktanella fryxellensis TaxID=245187 RepID=A0A1H8FJG9_9RHOB|nr:hypothetical protein [Loktanella fryxellensis]SEN31228.1 hypothetical protein SAMN04488003_11319 [Loktanella fryxellensis]
MSNGIKIFSVLALMAVIAVSGSRGQAQLNPTATDAAGIAAIH